MKIKNKKSAEIEMMLMNKNINDISRSISTSQFYKIGDATLELGCIQEIILNEDYECEDDDGGN